MRAITSANRRVQQGRAQTRQNGSGEATYIYRPPGLREISNLGGLPQGRCMEEMKLLEDGTQKSIYWAEKRSGRLEVFP